MAATTPRAPRRRAVPPQVVYETLTDADKREALYGELAKAERSHYAAQVRLDLLKAQSSDNKAGKAAAIAAQQIQIRNAAEIVHKLKAMIEKFGPADEDADAE